MGFVAFKLSAINGFLVLPFLPPMAFFGLLAAPFGHDQSSEVWLLAKIGFLLKPRRRIWDQTGMQELVTITAPKRAEENLTDGLTQTEVKSRLQALANTIDSRGWAVKNVNVNLYNQPSYLTRTAGNSDRLVDTSSFPQAVPNYEVMASDDILDEANNPTAQHLNAMISQSEKTHRQNLVKNIHGDNQATNAPADYWFMNQPASPPSQRPGYAMFDTGPAVIPGSSSAKNPATASDEDKALAEQIRQRKAKPNPAYGHMRVLDPTGNAIQNSKATVSSAKDDAAKAAIARLATNDDLNVSTIAREADKATKKPPDDEIVINLH